MKNVTKKKHKLAFSTRSKIIHFNETRPRFFSKEEKLKKMERKKLKSNIDA